LYKKNITAGLAANVEQNFLAWFNSNFGTWTELFSNELPNFLTLLSILLGKHENRRL